MTFQALRVVRVPKFSIATFVVYFSNVWKVYFVAFVVVCCCVFGEQAGVKRRPSQEERIEEVCCCEQGWGPDIKAGAGGGFEQYAFLE